MKDVKPLMGAQGSGLSVAGGIKPTEPPQGASGAGAAPAHPGVPPPVITLSSTVNLNQLWRTTRTARKFVQVVAYTLPPNAVGQVPPPRFRAFGLDMSTGAYVFVIDGQLQTELGPFTENMLRQKAILITTPPGVSYHGSFPSQTTDVATADAGPPISWGTEPVPPPPPPQGRDGYAPDWDVDWDRLPEMVRAVNTVLPDSFLPGGSS
ncbi:hypothetical protein D187_001681 [Cystobacter fuscus DSM 2262]|uniref:Uncharacterized protein n=1 Tax=Cystobacter fuscus (strain ATCC 25194 / DSM 2262 / NBRC 100088 / M29) TaxID=1242864 RepID=S9QIC6_CYSF2|nr:hypothetical protein [Cystobacter fuscus]EPX61029.1 hypothetical protein D187_001681 [Cystobacter fuscus DSM 2262]